MNPGAWTKPVLWRIVFFLGCLTSRSICLAKGGPPRDSVMTEAQFVAEGGVASSPATVGIAALGSQLALGKMTFEYGVRSYSWSQAEDLPFGDGRGDPWQSLHAISLGIGHGGELSESWRWFATAVTASAFEREIQDSFSGALFGGASYVHSPEWMFVVGAAGFAHQVVDPDYAVLPLLSVFWNRRTPAGWSGALSFPESNIAYRFNRALALRAATLWREGGLHRLADDSTVEPSGYVEEESLGIGLHLDVAASRRARASLGAQFFFNRELTFYDRDGRETRAFDLENTPVFAARFTLDL